MLTPTSSLSLFAFPTSQAKFVEVNMHVKDVNKVRFSADNQFVISIGQSDRSVIIWRVMPDAIKGPAKTMTG